MEFSYSRNQCFMQFIEYFLKFSQSFKIKRFCILSASLEKKSDGLATEVSAPEQKIRVYDPTILIALLTSWP